MKLFLISALAGAAITNVVWNTNDTLLFDNKTLAYQWNDRVMEISPKSSTNDVLKTPLTNWIVRVCREPVVTKTNDCWEITFKEKE